MIACDDSSPPAFILAAHPDIQSMMSMCLAESVMPLQAFQKIMAYKLKYMQQSGPA